jgi:hypothetical protein
MRVALETFSVPETYPGIHRAGTVGFDGDRFFCFTLREFSALDQAEPPHVRRKTLEFQIAQLSSDDQHQWLSAEAAKFAQRLVSMLVH